MSSNLILVYDTNTVPDLGIDVPFELVMRLYEEKKIVLYDSTHGQKPFLINTEEGPNPEVKVLDTKDFTKEEITNIVKSIHNGE